MTGRYAHLPPYLAQAFEQDDKVRAGEAAYERRLEELQAKRRDISQLGEVIYKRYEGPQPQQQSTTVQSQGTMSVEASRDWNRWGDEKVQHHLRAYTNKTITPMLREIGSLIGKLEREVAQQKSIKPYIEGRAYGEGSTVIHGGGCYRAQRDTTRMPGHSDWICLAAPGERGIDGRDADRTEIEALQKQLDRITARLIDLEVVHKAKVIDLPQIPLRHRHAG